MFVHTCYSLFRFCLLLLGCVLALPAVEYAGTSAPPDQASTTERLCKVGNWSFAIPDPAFPYQSSTEQALWGSDVVQDTDDKRVDDELKVCAHALC